MDDPWLSSQSGCDLYRKGKVFAHPEKLGHAVDLSSAYNDLIWLKPMQKKSAAANGLA
jgi:hypothetical protein